MLLLGDEVGAHPGTHLILDAMVFGIIVALGVVLILEEPGADVSQK